VLDIGPGRCEWLELLRENGIRAYGVDISKGFVRLAREKGLDVKLGDGVEHLRGVAEGSLAMITAFHVVEHLPIPNVLDLIDHSLRALRPGGILIIETPNPVNVSVGAGSFYLDPTHVRPMHPLLLKFMLEHRGFAEVRYIPMNPPDIPPITVSTVFSSDIAKIAEIVNRNFLTGQDYAVIGTAVKRPVAGEDGASDAGQESSTKRGRR
jgi:SAM-dependent methyltransferase